MKIAMLFPGQGSQSENFLHALTAHPATEKTLAEASAALGHDVLTLDTQEALQHSVNVQLSLVVAGVAFARTLRAEGICAVAMAGHSAGAFAAAVSADSISLPDALKTVRRRAELMELHSPRCYAMMAVDGLPRSLLEMLSAGTSLHIAVLNGPRRFVVVGPLDQLESLAKKIEERGARRLSMLDVPVASHHSGLIEAADELARDMDSIPIVPPSTTLIGNRNSRPLRTADAVREDLAYNMAAPVRWGEMVQAIQSFAPQAFVEAPPGHVLTRILEEDMPEQIVFAAGDMRLDSLLGRLRRL